MGNRKILGTGVVVCTSVMVGVLGWAGRPAGAHEAERGVLTSEDDSGRLRTIDVNGDLDLTNPFFKDLGTNGRTCFSCHRPDQGWTVTPEEIRKRFQDTNGL